MKTKKLKTYNRFDTLRMKIPGEVFSGVEWNKFHHRVKVSGASKEIDEEDMGKDSLWYSESGTGLSTLTYIPHLNEWDMILSAKVLREKYYEGISLDSMDKLFSEIVDRGICKKVNETSFISDSKVLRADNTFNIDITGDVADYYDSLELVVSKGKLGRVDTYSDGKTCSGIVLGKNTAKLQKITIYNKLHESKVVCSGKKYAGIPYPQAVEMEYGMKHSDFIDYFENKIRMELRVTNKEQLRKFYTNIQKGDVFLEDLLSSTNNVIHYQWNQMVKENDTKEAIDFLSLQLEDKRNYKLSSFSRAANWKLLKEFIYHFKGDEQKVLDKVRKLYYKETDGTLKKVSPSVRKDIVKFCAEYRQNRQKATRGELFSTDLISKYDEIVKGIDSI
jgi:hypothetical protein